MTDPEEPHDDGAQDGEPDERMVNAIRLWCPACRRQRARDRENERKGGAGVGPLKGPRPALGGRCPHYRDIHAPGHGPGSGSRALPGTPEERRQGPV